MTILIIENNLQMRRVIRTFVSGFNTDICEYDDAAQALQFYGKGAPEWVLFNLEIKDDDGVSKLVQIKKNWGGAKVVALTNYDEAELREAALNAGACACILKEDLSELRQLFLH